jgi:hypothetical protein
MWLLTSAFEKLRSIITAARSARTGFILHDPASSKPHDLDDPFFERKIQERVGQLIAAAAHRRHRRQNSGPQIVSRPRRS